MSYPAMINELERLRGVAAKGDSLAPYREQIERLYLQVCGKRLRRCKCKDVLKDALIEIYSKVKPNKKFRKNMAKARLVRGVVLQHNGNHYTNSNLTDKVAREFLDKFPQRKDWFEVLPEAQNVEQAAKTAENTPKIAPNSVKKKNKTTTPKKKNKTTTPKKKKTAAQSK